MSASSWGFSWILALTFLISASLPFTYAAPVSDPVLLPGSVDNAPVRLRVAFDEGLQETKFLGKRKSPGLSPGLTGTAWFERTRSNGDRLYAFGPDTGDKKPGIQLGSVSVSNKKLADGGFGTISNAILFEVKEEEICGSTETAKKTEKTKGLIAKWGEGDDGVHGGKIQNLLRECAYVPQVHKTLWIPPDKTYPEGQSLVIMESMASDTWDLVNSYPQARREKQPWAGHFNRLFMMEDLVTGLAYAHSLQIIHMDVKLENLMLRHNKPGEKYYHFAIIDWDMAMILTKEQVGQALKGTPPYMAPEVVKREYEDWPKGPDVYAAGICLLFAIVPDLLKPEYQPRVEAIHDKYRSPEEVEEYVKKVLGVRTKLFPETFSLLGQVLCAPWLRLSMADFEAKLRKYPVDYPYLESDLPLISLEETPKKPE
ncbi:NIMA-like serine/threonine kinase [Penicillium lagena]|uniref:NIMA-like serine/threonine kinase n=1 Tax=Penicillium lagena TaxID=94218 RepID=UPI0025424122|nr:NIMA-like serine/threonine kinase [Penicillium lagena]KAJ5601575.1 NIMA-like serine/threonine kinase [Penicillium lagena]